MRTDEQKTNMRSLCNLKAENSDPGRSRVDYITLFQELIRYESQNLLSDMSFRSLPIQLPNL